MKSAVAVLEQWLSGPFALWWLFAIYVAPRALVAFLYVEPSSDAAWYFNRAVAIAEGLGYSEGGELTAYWPPGWPLALGVLFKVFGPSLLVVQVLNLCCSVAIAWLTYDLCRRLFDSEPAGRAALLLLSLHPNSVAYMPLVFTEVFYTGLLLCACWLVVRPLSLASLFSAGIVFGIATLVKAQTLMVIPFAFGIALLRDLSLKSFAQKCLLGGIVLAVAVLTVLPWSLRNQRVFGEFVFVSTNGGLTLLTGNNPTAGGSYSPGDPLVMSIPRSVATQVEVDREAKRRAVEWIKKNPGAFVALLPRKVFYLWIPDGEGEWWYQMGYGQYEKHLRLFRAIRLINQVYYFALLGGFSVAGMLLIRRAARGARPFIDWWALPYAIAAHITAVSLVFSGQSRYHYCFIPFLAAASGWLLTVALPRYARRRPPLTRAGS